MNDVDNCVFVVFFLKFKIMIDEMISKKLSFCITCMNRIDHIKKTLMTNIKDNYLPEEVHIPAHTRPLLAPTLRVSICKLPG